MNYAFIGMIFTMDDQEHRLNKTNRLVYHSFCRADNRQKEQMRNILKEQLDNLEILMVLMDKAIVKEMVKNDSRN